ncbi:hypothetical protein LX81_03300, partial [Palleronia aestuarii]
MHREPIRRHPVRRQAGWRCGLAALAATAILCAPATAAPALGLDNPTLAFNLSGVKDYRPGLQFLDVMRLARPWTAYPSGQGENMDMGGLRKGGHLDENGWPTGFPEGYGRISTLWQWKSVPMEKARQTGTYLLRYEGEGEIEMRGVRVIGRAPGRIAFENTGDNMYLDILSTDPFGTGEHIRDITIVKREYQDLLDVGAVFNPDWLRLIEDARQIRFMDWNGTNNSSLRSWEDRVRPENPFGVSLEYMVQLANELGTDAWFTMPHMADADYIRRFATYVRDHLDPALTVRVEYSNETWNWMFEQAQWLLRQSQEHWGEDAHTDYQAKKAVEAALIWNEVFADAPDRIVHVIGTQATQPGVTERLLRAKKWQANEPDAFVPPTEVFDEVAITHYFGGWALRDDGAAWKELARAVEDPDIDATAYLAESLADPDYRFSIPDLAETWREQARIAHENGLGLVAYEGGQHEHHAGTAKGKDEATLDRVRAFELDFARSEAMGDLYDLLWETWMEIGDGPFMQFGDMTKPSKFGTWGLWESLDGTTPRAERLMALNRETAPWWDGAEAGSQYLQGVTRLGGPADEVMEGTPQED